MPFPTHRAAGALLLIAVAVLALPGCTKSKKPAAGKSPAPSASPSPAPSPTKPVEFHADFHPDSVAAVDAQNRPSSNDVAIAASKKVISLINAYYNAAFIEPGRWLGGRHPDLPAMFSDDARSSVAGNLQILALGNVASQLARVVPNAQQAAQIRVLVEPNQSASYAAVSTHFDGTGETAASGGQPVHIIHDFRILMNVGANQIVAYEVSTSEDSVAKSASYFPSDGRALAALGNA